MKLIDRTNRKNTDWWLVACYLILIVIGWLNIYSSIHSSSESFALFDLHGRSGKQFVWMAACLVVAALMLFVLSPRVYEGISLPLYGLVLLLLVAVIFVSHGIKGSHSWFELGFFRFQPAEISKISTSLLLARIMSQYGFSLRKPGDFALAAGVVILPALVILAQNETGLALVYVGFIFVFYREGLSGWIVFMLGMAIILFILTLTVSPYVALLVLAVVASLYNSLYTRGMKWWWAIYLPVFILLGFLPWLLKLASRIGGGVGSVFAAVNPVYILLGVCIFSVPFILYKAFRKKKQQFTILAAAAFAAGAILVFSTDIIFDHVLQEHQRSRIEVLLGMREDPSGVGYNVHQSMIAIGSGGLLGKGYLGGTQTTFGFVPEQSTDFIFCTVGEEWGFVGSLIVILIYVFMISRIIIGAERSTEAFTRIYGYCVAACFFMHLFINIGMTIGLMPVIGIPLPFLSYGGSSLLTFTILLFIFIVLRRNESRR